MHDHLTARAWATLERSIGGPVLRPEARGYAASVEPFNARFATVRPQAVVRCSSTNDVAEAVVFARRRGLTAAVRSGGHCFGGQSSTHGLLIDVGPMDAVQVADGQVVVQAGARLEQVYAALDGHGLTLPAGTCPGVGIAGLTLGGGLGILGRGHGLTADRLRAAEIVLADGAVLSCDRAHHGDLFWALQGAGTGSFGAVTSLTFDPIPAPTTAVNLRASWPWRQAGAVIGAWQQWAPEAPEMVSASLKLTVPRGHDGPPLVNLYATLFGDERIAGQLFEELIGRVGHEAQARTATSTDYPGARSFWANLDTTDIPDPPTAPSAQPDLLYAKSEYFQHPLPPDVIDATLAALVAAPTAAQTRELDFMPWGGAYSHRRPRDSAFAHRDDRFLLKHSVSVAPDAPPHQQTAAAHRARALWHTTHPAGTGRSYQNFADPDLTDWPAAYYGVNYRALGQVKTRYDPDAHFRHAQSIRPS